MLIVNFENLAHALDQRVKAQTPFIQFHNLLLFGPEINPSHFVLIHHFVKLGVLVKCQKLGHDGQCALFVDVLQFSSTEVFVPDEVDVVLDLRPAGLLSNDDVECHLDRVSAPFENLLGYGKVVRSDGIDNGLTLHLLLDNW